MSPVANPLVGFGGDPTATAAAASTAGPGPSDQFDPDISVAGSAGGYGVNLGAGFTSPDNTNVQVAAMVAGALLVVIFLHVTGFRFAVDTGVTRR